MQGSPSDPQLRARLTGRRRLGDDERGAATTGTVDDTLASTRAWLERFLAERPRPLEELTRKNGPLPARIRCAPMWEGSVWRGRRHPSTLIMSIAMDSPAGPAEHAHLQLNLLRGFELRRRDTTADVPVNVQRLVAFLALADRPQHRVKIAGMLWADSSEERAAANLRTALWRSRRIDDALVCSHGSYLELGPEVRVDLAEAISVPAGWSTTPVSGRPPTRRRCSPSASCCPSGTRIGSCSSVSACASCCCTASKRCAASSPAWAGTVWPSRRASRRWPPSRFASAQRARSGPTGAKGNMAEAVRQYDQFAVVLHDSLGIEPSDALRALVAPCR